MPEDEHDAAENEYEDIPRWTMAGIGTLPISQTMAIRENPASCLRGGPVEAVGAF
jgi:hypothetical protein